MRPLAPMQAVGRLSPAVWYPGYASRLSLPIDTPLRNAPLRPLGDAGGWRRPTLRRSYATMAPRPMARLAGRDDG